MTQPIRFSTLKAMANSPAHMLHAMTTELETSVSMRVGTAAHTEMLIRRDVVGSGLVVYPGRRSGKAWDAFAAAHTGVDILIQSEADRALACAASIRSSPLSAPLFSGPGINETRIDWTFDGVPFHSTPDRVIGSTLIELKTTRDARPDRFLRDAVRMHYHAQLAVYREALRQKKHAIDRVLIVAVETSAPYPVTVVELSERTLQLGYSAACGWLERYKVCSASNEWPAYSQSIVPWDIEPEMTLDFDGVEDAEEPINE